MARLRTSLIVPLVCIALLAGCTSPIQKEVDKPKAVILAQDESSPEASPGSGSSSVSSSTSPSDVGKYPAQEAEPQKETFQYPSGRIVNSPPRIDFQASRLEGMATLRLVLTVDGADVDGDALTYKLDADGDGDIDAEGDIPASIPFTYDQPGLFHAVATINDGWFDQAAQIDIDVIAPYHFEGYVSGSAGVTDLLEAAPNGMQLLSPPEHSHEFKILETSDPMVLRFSYESGTQGFNDLSYALFDPDGKKVYDGNAAFQVLPPMEPGLWTVTVSSFLFQQRHIHYDINIGPGCAIEGCT